MRVKALSFLIAGSLFMFACEVQKEEAPKGETKQEPAQKAEVQKTGPYALAESKGCFACHDIEKKKVGPAYKEVAKRYKDDPNAVDELVKSIVKGSMGKWGSIPMSPQPVSQEEAKQLAEWILSFK